MALPKIYTKATTLVTKTIKFVIKHAPEIGASIGATTTAVLTKVGFNIKEKHETMEEYKGWKVWKQGKVYYAKKNKNKFKLKTKDINNIKDLIDRYEENDKFEDEE